MKIAGEQSLDLSVAETTISGEVGATVEATVAAVNNGPAVIDSTLSGDPSGLVRFTVPEGTTVTTVPAGCLATADVEDPNAPGAASYDCRVPTAVSVGGSVSWTFGLRLDRASTDARGSLTVLGLHSLGGEDVPLPGDVDASNDTADVLVTTTGGSGAGHGSAKEPLAKTGASAPVLVGTAGALLVGGAALLLIRRRT